MSVRVYSGPHSDRGGGPTGWHAYIPWAFAAITIIGQIVWVLVDGTPRDALTVVTVVSFFLASASHSWQHRGAAWTSGFLANTLTFGWLIERIGLSTSFPFGTYEYLSGLGPSLFGVPVVIPLAWSMMAYPALVAAQRLSTTGLGVALIGGWLLAAWDLFLDPQMVSEKYWVWHDDSWALPGIPDIPMQNFLGWFLAAMALMWILDRLPRKTTPVAVPTVLLTWVWLSSFVGNLLFWGRPGVALWGGLAMGIVVVPYLWRMWSTPQW